MIDSSPIADRVERRLRGLFIRHDTARCAQPANQRGPPIDTLTNYTYNVQSTKVAQACKVIARWEYFSGRGMVSLHHVTALCVKSENEDVAAEW